MHLYISTCKGSEGSPATRISIGEPLSKIRFATSIAYYIKEKVEGVFFGNFRIIPMHELTQVEISHALSEPLLQTASLETQYIPKSVV
jgi:hypothetical protein